MDASLDGGIPPDHITAMIARVEAEARRKIGLSTAAAAAGAAKHTPHSLAHHTMVHSVHASLQSPAVLQPPVPEPLPTMLPVHAAAAVAPPPPPPPAPLHTASPLLEEAGRLRSASPVQPSATPGPVMLAGHTPQILQVLQTEKESALLQLAQAQQALTIERSLVESKNDEFKEVLEALKEQLAREKEANFRLAAERDGDNDSLRKRCAELEEEMKQMRTQANSVDTHLQQKGYESARIFKQLEETTRERERDLANMAQLEADLTATREQLVAAMNQAKEEEVVCASMKSELVEMVTSNEELVKQLRSKDADNERLAHENRQLKLQAMESGQNGDVMARQACDAEALAVMRSEQLIVAEKQATQAEHDSQEMRLQLQEATMKRTAVEKRCTVLEEENQKSRDALAELESSSTRQRAGNDTLTAKLKATILDLETHSSTQESEMERLRSACTTQEAEAHTLKHALEAELEDFQRKASQMEGEVQRTRGELSAYDAAAKQTQAALEERVLREKTRTQQVLQESEALREQVSQLRIAEQQTCSELARERAGKDTAVELASDDARQLRDRARALQLELDAKTESMCALEEELVAAKRHETEKELLLRRFNEKTAEAEMVETKLREVLADFQANIASQTNQLLAIEQELTQAKHHASDKEAEALRARAQLEDTTQVLESVRKDQAATHAMLEKAQVFEIECVNLQKRIADITCNTDTKSMECERLRTELAETKSALTASRTEEDALRREIASLITKITEGDQELAKLMAERDVSYQHHINTNSTLSHEVAEREALQKEVGALQTALCLAREATALTKENEAALLQPRRYAAAPIDTDATRPEMVRAVCTLLTELGIVRQGLSSTLTNQTLRKALVRNKAIIDDMNRNLDRLGRARQQAKQTISGLLTDVEKMHYGASDWRELPTRSLSAKRGGSVRSRSASLANKDLRDARSIKSRMQHVDHTSSPVGTPKHVPLPLPVVEGGGGGGGGVVDSPVPNYATLRSFTVNPTFGSPKRPVAAALGQPLP